MAAFDDLLPMTNPVLIERNLSRQQGAYWEVRQYLEVDNVPIAWATGYVGVCQIRTRAGAFIATFVCTFTAGWLVMRCDSDTTVTVLPGNYVYAVTIYPTGVASKKLALMGGSFAVTAQVNV